MTQPSSRTCVVAVACQSQRVVRSMYGILSRAVGWQSRLLALHLQSSRLGSPTLCRWKPKARQAMYRSLWQTTLPGREPQRRLQQSREPQTKLLHRGRVTRLQHGSGPQRRLQQGREPQMMRLLQLRRRKKKRAGDKAAARKRAADEVTARKRAADAPWLRHAKEDACRPETIQRVTDAHHA